MNKKEIYLSFNMIVQNEESRIRNCLENIKDIADEIIIVDGGSTDNTIEICKKYTDKVFIRKFTGDFADQKNFANSKCNGIWIFNIDADELLSNNLKSTLKEFLKLNEHLDLLYVGRKNTIPNLDMKFAKKWGWNVSDNGLIQYPDIQSRIYKNLPSINWSGKVHERIAGSQSHAILPVELDLDICILHEKDMKRQIKQNAFYEKIQNG